MAEPGDLARWLNLVAAPETFLRVWTSDPAYSADERAKLSKHWRRDLSRCPFTPQGGPPQV